MWWEILCGDFWESGYYGIVYEFWKEVFGEIVIDFDGDELEVLGIRGGGFIV